MQNPLFQKAKESRLPGEKVPARADEGWENDILIGSHPYVTVSPQSFTHQD